MKKPLSEYMKWKKADLELKRKAFDAGGQRGLKFLCRFQIACAIFGSEPPLTEEEALTIPGTGRKTLKFLKSLGVVVENTPTGDTE